MGDYVYDKVELAQVEKAVALFEGGDGSGSIFILKRLLADGYWSAFATLGLVFEIGCADIERDLNLATKYYLDSVEKIDDVLSHRALARIYFQDAKRDRDRKLLRYHLDILDDSNEMGGAYGLGLVYQYGLGEPIDKQRAAEYFNKAISMGHLIAKSHLLQVAERPTIQMFVEAIWVSLKAKILLWRGGDHPELGV